MKKNVLKKLALSVILLLSLSLLILTSCAPERGTHWFYGDTEPEEILDSAVGDFYYDTEAQIIYVLSEDGWQELANTKGKDGKDGTNGKDGADWLYGTSAPTGNDGVDGDLWLDTSSLKMYKKSEGIWTQIADFKN